MAGLLQVNGMLYGTTQYGGSGLLCGEGDGCGSVFSINPVTGAETILHFFKDDGKDGRNPMGGLIEVNGKLYGTTEKGGANGLGTVFSLDLSTGKERVIYSFCGQQNCSDGSYPFDSLIEVGGTLYGTAGGGGISAGAVFSLKP